MRGRFINADGISLDRRGRLRAIGTGALLAAALAVPAAIGTGSASAASFNSFTSNPLSVICPSDASSTPTIDGPQYSQFGQYGEVNRFGGFDTTVYDDESSLSSVTHSQWL